MSLSFLTPEVAQRIEQALGNLEQSSQVWQEFVTFPSNTTVQTESGPIPSLRWLIDNQMQLVVDAIATLRSIQQVTVDPVTNNLIVTYSDGATQNAGRVTGADGADGVSVINVNLYSDPLEPDEIYFQTELSNGLTLRTQNSLRGYNGKSISTVTLIENNFVVTLEDGAELPPIPISGLTPVSVSGALIRDGELIIQLSNGQEAPAGMVNDLKGRGIVSLRKTNGILQASFSDAPTTFQDIGEVKGLISLEQVDNKLMAVFDTDPETPVELATVTSFVGGRISEDEHLILITNAPSGQNEIDLGPVLGLKPQDGSNGLSVDSATIVDNEFVFTVGGLPLPPVPVSGLTPISIVGATIVDGMLVFQLTNNQQIVAGVAEDLKGAGVVSARLDPDGKLYFFYDSAPTTAVFAGVVPGIASVAVENGRLLVRYTNDPTTAVDAGALVSVTGVSLVNGRLVVSFNNNQQSDIGALKAVEQFLLDASGVLSVRYNDTTTQLIGNIKGAPGPQGPGLASVSVTPSGDLVITWTDGRPEQNLGRVRSDTINYLGKTYRFNPEAGVSTLPISHNGEAVVFINGELKDPIADYDLSTADQIAFTAPFVGTEKVMIIVYQLVGSTPSGNGVQSVEKVSATVYNIVLENGQVFPINIYSEPVTFDLPPGVDTIEVLPNGEIQVTLTNGNQFIAGSANNAVSLVNATINASGHLILETNDPTNQFIDVGNVLADIGIDNAIIDQETGHLIITLSTGQVFDAGAVTNYVQTANIRSSDGMLLITLSTGQVIEAGTVRNPLIGTAYDFLCFEGQYEFAVNHQGYQVLVWARGVSLQGEAVDLTDPTKVKLRTPREENDPVRIILLTSGNVVAQSLVGQDTAPVGSVYGIDPTTGNPGFYLPALTKFGTPFDYIAAPGQTVFAVNHGGAVEVFVDGRLYHSGEYVTPAGNSYITLSVPLVGGEKVRIVALVAPKPVGSLIIANYARIGFLTNNHGGSFVAGQWQMRSLNTILENNIGLTLNLSRMVFPAGRYYVKGWAACNGVATNALRLFNQTTNQVLKVGPAVFAPRDVSTAYQAANCLTPIDGYFEVTTQSAVILQHKSIHNKSVYGFGVVGGGVSTSVATSSGPTQNTELGQLAFGSPATLVDLEFWKVD